MAATSSQDNWGSVSPLLSSGNGGLIGMSGEQAPSTEASYFDATSSSKYDQDWGTAVSDAANAAQKTATLNAYWNPNQVTNAAVGAMTPAQQQTFVGDTRAVNVADNAGGGFWGGVNEALPYIVAGLATAGVGSAVAAGVGGGLGGALAGGATAGALNSAADSGISGRPLTLGSVGEGAGLGALGGGLTYGLGPQGINATGAMTNAGVPAPLSSGLVKAGTGALAGAIGGGSPLAGAVAGGVGGATSSALGSAAVPGGAIAGGLLGGVAAGALAGNNSTGSSMGYSSALTNNGGGSALANGSTLAGSGTGAGYDFSSLGSTVGSLLGPALQSAGGVYGAQNASEQEQQATSNAIAEQNATLANAGNIFGAQRTAGNNAFSAIQGLEGGTSTPANYSNFINSPGYNFAISQGTQAIDRQAAAAGSAYTPNTLAAVGQYVTGTASQNYNNYMQQLLGTAQLGAQGNTGLSTANTTIGGNTSTLMQNLGVEQAQGTLGAASALSPLLGGLGNGVASLTGLGGSNNIGGLTGSNPSNLGGSTPTAPSGSTLQYDADGNIIGSSALDQNSSGTFNSVTDTGASAVNTDPSSWLSFGE